ncbi:hypothetical protein GCM10007377_08530 [Galliscardovia ingluviei]|uniref:Uncharacterized protein n=2 Tax=Galliscardovia ingluviei TaxID=1769422 RepID=A0A8J3EY88_9BIFI|nr:hypothetical protein GCM10007377_08530 [Galliscardovia ingluviei]
MSSEPRVPYVLSFKELGFNKDERVHTASTSVDGKYLFSQGSEKISVRNLQSGKQEVFKEGKRDIILPDYKDNAVVTIQYDNSDEGYVSSVKITYLDKGKTAEIPLPNGKWNRLLNNPTFNNALLKQDVLDATFSFISQDQTDNNVFNVFSIDGAHATTQTRKLVLPDFVDADDLYRQIGAPMSLDGYMLSLDGALVVHINKDDSDDNRLLVEAYDTSNGQYVAQWNIENTISDIDVYNAILLGYDEQGIPYIGYRLEDDEDKGFLVQLDVKQQTVHQQPVPTNYFKGVITGDSELIGYNFAHHVYATRSTDTLGKSSQVDVIDYRSLAVAYSTRLDASYGGAVLNTVSNNGRYFFTTQQKGKKISKFVVKDLKTSNEQAIDYPIKGATVENDSIIPVLSADNTMLTFADTDNKYVVVVATGVATSTLALVKHELGQWWIVVLIAATVLLLIIVVLIVLLIVKKLRNKRAKAQATPWQGKTMNVAPAVQTPTSNMPFANTTAAPNAMPVPVVSAENQEQADLPFCMNCGARQRTAQAKFCSKCGTRLEE